MIGVCAIYMYLPESMCSVHVRTCMYMYARMHWERHTCTSRYASKCEVMLYNREGGRERE